VDNCFDARIKAGFPDEMSHSAFHNDMPGRVDLWPVVDKTETPEEGAWFNPVDRLSGTHETVVLARRIASEIARMIREKETIAAEMGEAGVYAPTRGPPRRFPHSGAAPLGSGPRNHPRL